MMEAHWQNKIVRTLVLVLGSFLAVAYTFASEDSPIKSEYQCNTPDLTKKQVESIVADFRKSNPHLPGAYAYPHVRVRREFCHYFYNESSGIAGTDKIYHHKVKTIVLNEYGEIVSYSSPEQRFNREELDCTRSLNKNQITELLEKARKRFPDLPPLVENASEKVGFNRECGLTHTQEWIAENQFIGDLGNITRSYTYHFDRNGDLSSAYGSEDYFPPTHPYVKKYSEERRKIKAKPEEYSNADKLSLLLTNSELVVIGRFILIETSDTGSLDPRAYTNADFIVSQVVKGDLPKAQLEIAIPNPMYEIVQAGDKIREKNYTLIGQSDETRSYFSQLWKDLYRSKDDRKAGALSKADWNNAVQTYLEESRVGTFANWFEFRAKDNLASHDLNLSPQKQYVIFFRQPYGDQVQWDETIGVRTFPLGDGLFVDLLLEK